MRADTADMSAPTLVWSDPHGADPEEVLDAARDGAAWALRSLYESLAPAVAGYARAQAVRDPEGVVNDVFLRAFRRLPQFRGSREQLRSWVFAIARNVVIDEHRRWRRRVQETPIDASVHGAAVASAEDAALTGLEQEQVQALLARLPSDQREVLVMRLVGDLSIPEIAHAIGRSVGATKALQRRALRRLRTECSAGGDGS